MQEGGIVKDKAQETTPTAAPTKGAATVSTGTKQAGKADDQIFWRWLWAEPAVWTTRMLTALEQGVKGGRWFSLIDKVYPLLSLEAAFRKVAANKGAAGVDHVTIEMFAANPDVNLRRLSEDLRDGSYRPQAIRRTWIPKPGSREMRPLGIQTGPTVRDRVV